MITLTNGNAFAYRYDSGLKVQASENADSAIFCCLNDKTGIPVPAVMGIYDIPDVLLTRGRPVVMYENIRTEDGSYTINCDSLIVYAAPEPDDYVPPERQPEWIALGVDLARLQETVADNKAEARRHTDDAVAAETANRQNSDERIEAKVVKAQSDIEELREELMPLQNAAHTHENKAYLDGLSDEYIKRTVDSRQTMVVTFTKVGNVIRSSETGPTIVIASSEKNVIGIYGNEIFAFAGVSSNLAQFTRTFRDTNGDVWQHTIVVYPSADAIESKTNLSQESGGGRDTKIIEFTVSGGAYSPCAYSGGEIAVMADSMNVVGHVTGENKWFSYTGMDSYGTYAIFSRLTANENDSGEYQYMTEYLLVSRAKSVTHLYKEISEGGGGGAVNSVNGKTGNVVLAAGDIKANPQLSVAQMLNEHESRTSANAAAIESLNENKADKTELPTKLPNPSALTFTGASTGTYDGSNPLTINIPAGGEGGGDKPWTLIDTLAFDGTVASWEFNALPSYSEIYIAYEGMKNDTLDTSFILSINAKDFSNNGALRIRKTTPKFGWSHWIYNGLYWNFVAGPMANQKANTVVDSIQVPYCHRYIGENVGHATKIKIFLASQYAPNAGTMQIYGR